MINLNIVMENLKSCISKVAKFQLSSLENKTFKIEEKKTEFDMVTEIDKKSEKMIMEFITTNYPEHAILTEETGFHDGSMENEYEWVIDPIDGTTNFIHGFPFHCISVGLRYKGETVMGLVNAPQLNTIFSSVKGKGAFKNDKKISVSETKLLHKSIVVTGFPYERAVENPNLKCFNSVVNKVAGIRRTGSAALDLCFVASGNFDAYWEYNVKEWDICAGELILKEAGGTSQKFIQNHNTLFYFGNGSIDSIMLEVLL